MPEQTTAAKTAEELEDEEEEGVEVPTNRPGMRAVRRRSSSGRRHRRRTSSDTRFRQLRIGLLCVVILTLFYQITPHSLRDGVKHGFKQVFQPFLSMVIGLHLEVVALIIAAVILIYLTPGVEDYVFRLLGIKRTGSSRR